MNNNGSLFVKVNYKLKGTGKDIRCDARINYINAAESDKYSIGGGFSNKDSCSLVFKANNLEEAKEMMKDNPILKKWKQRYNEIKCDFIVVPGF